MLKLFNLTSFTNSSYSKKIRRLSTKDVIGPAFEIAKDLVAVAFSFRKPIVLDLNAVLSYFSPVKQSTSALEVRSPPIGATNKFLVTHIK